MSQAFVKLTTDFADETKRDLEFGPLATTAADVETIRTRVKNFDPADVQGLYLSDGGATCTGISAASITVIGKREINLNGDD